MTLVTWAAEFLAALYLLLPWYAGLVLLRGLLWVFPLRFLPVQRLLFRLTEPAVRRVRDSFGLSLRRYDPSLPVTAAVLLAFRYSALRGALNWLLVHQSAN